MTRALSRPVVRSLLPRPDASLATVAAIVITMGWWATGGAHGRATLTTTVLLAVQAVAWRAMFAGAGQLFLAVGGIAAIAAYGAVIAVEDFGWGWLGAGGMSITVAVAVAAGLTAVAARRRLSAMYGGVVTLVAALAIGHMVVASRHWTGGETGRVVLSAPRSLEIGSMAALLVAVVLLVGAVAACGALAASRRGLAASAVRDDATAAQLAGVNLVATHVVVAMVAAVFIAASGLAKAALEGFVSPSMFAFGHVDVRVVLAALIGVAAVTTLPARRPSTVAGLERLGPVVGAMVLGLADEWLRGLGQLRTTVYGVGLLVVVMALHRRGAVRATVGGDN